MYSVYILTHEKLTSKYKLHVKEVYDYNKFLNGRNLLIVNNMFSRLFYAFPLIIFIFNIPIL